jgi:hypothetical protein
MTSSGAQHPGEEASPCSTACRCCKLSLSR